MSGLFEGPREAGAPAGASRPLLWYILRGIVLGLLGVVALVAVLILVVPLVTGAQRHAVPDASMEPAVPRGSLVVVQPVPLRELAPGDIVAVQPDSSRPAVLTRRVVGVSVSSEGVPVLRTRGDAVSGVDTVPTDTVPTDAVPADQVRGRVWYILPGLGWVEGMLASDMRVWVLPAVAVILFGYAGWVLLRAWLASHPRGKHARAGRRVAGV